MGRKRRKRPGPLGSRPNRRLDQDDRELIVQTHAAIGTIAGTARQTGVCDATVVRVLKEAEGDLTLMQARGRALDALAGKAHHEAERILGSITDEDLTSTISPVNHPNGNFARYQELGPSLADKARAFGIIADKSILLRQARLATHPASSDPASLPGEMGLLLPTDADEARRQIAMKVKRLRIVDLEFSQGETGRRVDDLTKHANLSQQDVEDADYVPFGSGPDPFD